MGHLKRGRRPTHQGLMESPHRTAARFGSGSRHCLLRSPFQLSPRPGLLEETLLHSLPASLTPDPLPQRPSFSRPTFSRVSQWQRENAHGGRDSQLEAYFSPTLVLDERKKYTPIRTRGEANLSQSEA